MTAGRRQTWETRWSRPWQKQPKQLLLVPLVGLEWEGRKVLYQIADSVVNRAEHRVQVKSRPGRKKVQLQAGRGDQRIT